MPFSKGVVAIIDIMGFKGIWKEADPDKIINLLKEVEDEAKSQCDRWNTALKGYGSSISEFKVACLSDTLIFGISVTKEHPNITTQCIQILGHSLRKCLDLWLLSNTPRTMRGCVSYGEFIIEGNYLIGPAIDDAAEWHEKSDGSFIWCTEQFINNYDGWSTENDEWLKYDVPLKGTQDISTYVFDISYSLSLMEIADDLFLRMPLRSQIIRSFGDDERLKQKMGNTDEFLHHCLQTHKFKLCDDKYVKEHIDRLP